jgi:hypothetical protein
MGIQIHELTALNRAPQTGDVLAVDTGTTTNKVDYGALRGAVLTDAVRTDDDQNLTDAQKAQAIENIGAATQADVTAIEDEIGNTTLPTTAQTVTGAIAEHETDISNINSAIGTVPSGSNLQGEVDGIKSDLSKINDIEIGGFSKAFRDANATVVTGAYIDTNGNPASTSAWAYCYTNVTAGEKYKVTGVAGTGGRLYLFKNSAGQVIYVYPSETNVAYVGLEITAPENAATLYVNTSVGRVPVPSIQETYLNFISDSYGGAVICENISGTTYKITCGSYEHEIDLNGSNNGTFNFTGLKRNNENFKAVADDIAPIKLQTAGYVGANHGYAWVYSCVISGHGLTVADIGKTSTDGTNTWVLIQVTDINTIVVGCYDSTVWYKLKRVSPTTLNFGGSDLSVTLSGQVQLYPSVKNVNVTINSNDPTKTIIIESYEIIDVGSGIEAIKTNVGSNTNTSIATRADALIRICNSYEFFENGSVVIYTSTKVLKTGVGIEYLPLGVQSGAFTASDSVWVPQVTGYDGAIPESGTQIDFLKTKWKVANTPPQEYIQLNGTVNTARKSMIVGYIINDGRADNIDTSSGFVSTAGKMYPYFVQPNNSFDSITEFSTISYRIPQAYNAFVAIPGFDLACGYTYIGNDIYLFINTNFSNGNIDFPVPSFMQRKKITTVMSKDMTCQSKVSTNVISLSYATRGSIILKLSD